MDKHKTAEWQTEIENGYEFGKKKKISEKKSDPILSPLLTPPFSALNLSIVPNPVVIATLARSANAKRGETALGDL